MTIPPRARNRAFLLLSILLVALCGSFGSSTAQESVPSVTVRAVDANSRGQIAVMDLTGAQKLRILGIHNPMSPFRMPDGRVLVFDLATREVLALVDSAGALTIGRTWSLPHNASEPVLLSSPQVDVLVVVDRKGTTFRFVGDAPATTTPAPESVRGVKAGTILSDGRFLVLRSDATELGQSLFVVRPDDLVWSPVKIAGSAPADLSVPTGIAAAGDRIYLWRGGAPSILYGTALGDVITVAGYLTYPGLAMVVPTVSSGVLVVTFNALIAHLNESGSVQREYQFITPPTDALFNEKDNSLWLLHQYPLIREWPEWRNNLVPQQTSPFNWAVFQTIVGVALVAALVWTLCAVRWGYEALPARVAPTRRVELTSESWSLQGVVAVIGMIAAAAIGLFVAWGAQASLLNGLGKEIWRLPYIGGALLVGVVCEVYRRWRPQGDEPKPFSAVLKEPAPKLGLALLVPLTVLVIVSWILYSMGVQKQYTNGYREGVFSAGLITVLAVLLADAWVCRRQLLGWLRAEWVFLVLPLLIGSFTLFYRLGDLPYNTHFDFTTHAFVAEQFLRGIHNGWWEWGFVPAPVIGSFPEMLGFLLVGFNPIGYRFGSALFNLSAILAVYILGREYRNARVGFWAAIILAGNTAFIHFGRLMSNGSSATLALWSITTLALALRYKRSSLWLLTGVVAAATFYQWPVARVGAVTAALMYGVVALRFPLRQAKQLSHHIFGAAGVALLLAPFIIMWMVYPERLMPRAQESLTGLTVDVSSLSLKVRESTLQLFFQSLGWIFSEYDRSSQGSTSPGFNSIEAVLFACGLAILFLEGFSLNILLGLMLLVTLLVCGAWAVGPPWYTRVLPSAPIACLLIARALEGLHNLVCFSRRKLFWGLFWVLSALAVFVSPWTNFKKYFDYETAAVRRSNLYPHVAIGRAIDETGPKYRYVFLLLGEPSWRFNESPIGHLLPYISERKLRECYDVRQELPVKPDEPKAFIVQVERFNIDVPAIKEFHPDAKVTPIEDLNHDRVAYLVVVDR